jgi:alanine racemase
LNLYKTHTLGIFEAGISLPDEMEQLEKIIQPDISILTHFGNAHSEGFSNDTEKLNEKLKLFSHSKISIIQRYHNSFLQQQNFPSHFINISELPSDKIFIKSIEIKFNYSVITLKIDDEEYTFQIPFVDEASIKNSITCFTCIYFLNKSLIQKILPSFAHLPVVSLRLEIKKAKFQSTLIGDYYNSDIDSFQIAMSYLHHYVSSKKVLILSDFDEIKNFDDVYSRAIQIIHHYPLNKIILIGQQWKNYLSKINISYKHYLTTSECIDNLMIHSAEFDNATILLKGARKFEFEKIAQLLELKTHDTILEVNIPALWHNLSYYKNLVGKNVKLMCMIKAAAYGSGSIELAYALQKFGIDYFAVAYTDEGVELKQAGIQTPIMVMLPEIHSFNDIINYQLEPEIYSFEILQAFIEELKRQGIQHYPIHLKIDTGMHRLGFLPDEVENLVNIIQKNPAITIKSVFSHLAASESDEHKDFTLQQIETFKKIAHYIEEKLQYCIIKHICNSAAISRFPDAHFDMVRVGIGMYGISENLSEQQHLKNVLSLTTKIAQVKHLKKGDSVGYSRNGKIEKDSVIAVIPIGYADGFSRKLGNGNFSVKYNGLLVPTIGNVCMDMTMIDVSQTNAKAGDEIVIFDSIEDIVRMSKATQTIPYEILTSISSRVKRVYVYE